MMRSLILLSALTLFLISCQQGGESPRTGFDVVILNGRVMDPETQLDSVMNVGVKDGVIQVITTSDILGTQTIDATGHVVSPGFIDTQAHSHGNLWGVKVMLRDGVTSPMDLEYGNINTGAWYAARMGKWPVNFAAAASHEMHRMRVLDNMPLTEPLDAEGGLLARGDSYKENGIPDWAETQSTLEQINQIMAGIDEELRQGRFTAKDMKTGDQQTYSLEGWEEFCTRLRP